MKETDVQKRVIDAVRAHGGAAHKLSNRFLVGVPDLLIKLPGLPAFIMEVKLDKRAVFPDNNRHPVVPDVTRAQWNFLKEYHDASMMTGVLSFVQHKRQLFCLHVFLPHYRLGDGLRPTSYYPFDPETIIPRLKDDL